MIERLLPLLPSPATKAAVLVALAATLVGVGLWLAGSRFSRSLVALLAVAAGTWAGLAIPRWMGWGINPMATGIAGAIVLGVCGYWLHRAWVGAGLALVLASWAALAVWLMGTGGESLAWPAVDMTSPVVVQTVRELWTSLPDTARGRMPWVCGVAALVGVALSVLLPRVATAVMYSMLGVSVALATSLCVMESTGRPWRRIVPTADWAQATIIAALVLFGVIVQWRLSTNARPATASQNAGDDDDDEQ